MTLLGLVRCVLGVHVPALKVDRRLSAFFWCSRCHALVAPGH